LVLNKKKELQPSALDPNPARLNQTKENNKHQTSEKTRIGQTAPLGPQSVSPSQTNTTSNPQTNEPINNICISNDYETAAEAKKEPKTYDNHATTNK
jgi:hypothetical protein